MSRRLPRRTLLAALFVVCGTVLLLAPAAGAAAPRAETSGRRGIEVVQVDGLIDPPNATLIKDSIADANRKKVSLLVLKLGNGGAVDTDPAPLVTAILRSRVPIAVWIGPSGSKAKGIAALLAAAAPINGVSNGSSIGPAAPLRLDDPGATRADALRRELGALSQRNGRKYAGGVALIDRSLSSTEAARIGATDRICPRVPGCATLGEFVVGVSGRTVRTAAGEVKLDTAKLVRKDGKVVRSNGAVQRTPNQEVHFRKLDLGGQAVHTLVSPSIAYLLFAAGLALMVFEFFTISVGLAGGAGAVAVIGACVGFSHLPVHWWAIALLLVAMFGYSIDVQAGRPAAWTVIGTAAFVAGSLFLYGGSSRLDVHWWVLAIVILGVLVFMAGAMPVAVRSRFSTPTVGREGLIGEMGEAAVDVSPDGVVMVRGARWRARTNRATPIRAGDAIRVIEVVGLVLEVEPETGGAKDYRERRGRHEAGKEPGGDER
jgi:membrane-bound serine protease (ClpP class)